MMNKLKKIADYKYLNCCLIILASIISIFWVCVIDNIHYFNNSFKGTETINNITYQKEENNMVVNLKTSNKYLYELEFLGKNTTKNTIYYNVYAYDNKKEIFLNQERLSNVYDGINVIRIGKETDEIKLLFVDANAEDFELTDLKVSNTYQVNLLKLFGLIVSIYLIFDLIMLVFKTNKPKLANYFFKVAVLIGMVIAFASPLYYSLDEKEHFIRAYNISEFNFLKTKNDMVKWPANLGPVIDNPASIFVPSTYRSYVYNLKYLDEISKQDYTYQAHNSSAEPYLFPGYFVSGVAIFITKLFGLSFPYQFYLGRIFNVIFYAFIVALAIKLCPKYAKLIFALGLLPGLLFQSASYSADVVTNAFALLAVALTIYYRDLTRKIKFKDLIILLFSYIMAFITKIAYFPIVLLIYLIPNKKFNNQRKARLAKILIPLIGLIVFALASLYAQKIGIIQWPKEGVNSTLQLKYILANPISYLYTLYKTLQASIISITATLTTQLGYCGLTGELDFIIIIGTIVFAIASCTSDLRKFDKIVLALIVLCCVGAAMSSMYISYNVVGNSIVEGFQGRYLAPVLLPFLLLFSSPKFKIDIKEKKILISLISIMVLLNIHAIITIFLNVYN